MNAREYLVIRTILHSSLLLWAFGAIFFYLLGFLFEDSRKYFWKTPVKIDLVIFKNQVMIGINSEVNRGPFKDKPGSRIQEECILTCTYKDAAVKPIILHVNLKY